MSNRRRLAVASTLVVLSSTAAHAAQPAAQILHHESIAITEQKGATTERVSFEAFGKHFDLLLEPNERIRKALPSEEARGIVPLRGTIEGLPGSWVRLTRGASGGWQGMLSDGQEIYAIETAGNIRTLAVQPLEKSDSAPVIYRLADLIVEWGAAFCEALPAGEKTTGLDAFKSLGQEFQAEAISSTATKQMTVGIVGDYEFFSYFNPSVMTAQQAVVSRMNVVDGIFSEQAGVTLEVPTITLYQTSSDPFTKYESKELLDEARQFRKSSAEHLSRGVTHLMTGRDLSGDTVGVAYLGTICGGEYAVSLSEGSRSSTMAALIAAHEIGHNFNAPHDGEGACASTPQTFLMAPRLNGSNQFSSCSLEQMQPTIALARCLRTYSPADAAVEISASTVEGTVNNALMLQFYVRSTGGSSCQDVSVTVILPPELTVNSSAAEGGTCTAGAGSISCTFGSLEAGAARNVTLGVTSQNAGTFPVDLSVTATNDSVSTNNTGRVDVVIAATAPNPGQMVNASGDGGGGGGSLSFAMLGALSALSLWRGLRR